MIRGLFFDFDGLLVDTETAALAAWRGVYNEHGHELSLDLWIRGVGTRGGFDPLVHLVHLESLAATAARPFDRERLDVERRRRELELADAEDLRPGVAAYLDAARARGLVTAVVSSSSEPWIVRHLSRLKRHEDFDAIVAAGTDPQRAKPRPTLYLEALDRFRLTPDHVIAFEDSTNGILAAKGAGIYTVAVPNAVTAASDFSAADLVVASLEHMSLDAVITRAESAIGRRFVTPG